ncbi:response regulator transcription factor [Ruficoccus amylovorans]|uniref:Response regulator transcription factor n=1 Tax=Ruficoccus amylovorans TaxID=1804625 RepID=A0A842HEQ2_9BACT|nr:response regulator transcription factor [Ruficoccus amylovorans]
MKTAYIIEDEALLRELVQTFISSFTQMEIVGSCGDGAVAMREINEKKPDLILADIRVPAISGLEALYLIKREHPASKVILFTGAATPENVRIARDGQVDGFIEKGEGLEEFQRAIEALSRDECYFSEHVRAILARIGDGD